MVQFYVVPSSSSALRSDHLLWMFRWRRRKTLRYGPALSGALAPRNDSSLIPCVKYLDNQYLRLVQMDHGFQLGLLY